MNQFGAIVVATDFSEGAARAARRGALLADARGLPVELVHIVSASELETVRAWFSYRSDLVETLTADAQLSLDSAAMALAAPGRSIITRLIVGDVHDELKSIAARNSLLVMGARGETTLGEILFGSTVERVVGESEGPVLVVRSEPRGPYQNVLLGADLDHGCATLLGDVVDFSPGARFTALNAYHVPFEGALHRAGFTTEEIERQRGSALKTAIDGINSLVRQLHSSSLLVLPVAQRGDPARLLVEHGKHIGADLLAVARRSRSRLAALLMGSVTRHVVANADRDVLVLRGPALT
ncbi:MAG: universal stress protein [Burkholderiales bacterium]|nr:universal stress protein [Burkholderiales bacterium]